MHEVTFVIQAAGRTVFFGADSLRVPELDTVQERFGPIDLAILPTNGLCIRPMDLCQVVMDAEEAAGLTGVLKPTLAVPHHYAFHSGWLGDRMITKGDQDPRHYADAVGRIAPEVDVRLVLPGVPVRSPERRPAVARRRLGSVPLLVGVPVIADPLEDKASFADIRSVGVQTVTGRLALQLEGKAGNGRVLPC